MPLQELSYQLTNERIPFPGFLLSAEIFSFENVYTIAPKSLRKEGGRFTSSSLLWGDDVPYKGSFEIESSNNEDSYGFIGQASLSSKNIRSVKLRFDNLPVSKLVNCIDKIHYINGNGLLINYPEAWRSLWTPLLMLKCGDNDFIYFRVMDHEVRPIRFYLREENGKMRVEIIIEAIASHPSQSFILPTIEIGHTTNPDLIYAKQKEFLEKRFSYVPYSQRKDVPAWFKKVSLVCSMHMEAFTGHVFHTYKSALEDAKKLCSLFPGENILFYLPGWEGRYYYDYGNYEAADRLGGEKDLRALIKGIHDLGSHVIPMYGINLVSRQTPGFSSFGPDSEFVLAGGGTLSHGSVDWDGSHHFDFDELASLNIAAKPWQDHLFSEIASNVRKYDFDGVFLDIAALDVNDKNQEYLPGLFAFCERLHSLKSNFLISGECAYDAMLMAMPLFQCGHTDGHMNFHDRPYEDFFTPYAREFAHLSLGDPAFHSTGVHEQGYNLETKIPLRKGLIPTISVIDGTLNKAPEDVKKVVAQAQDYRRRYLQ